MQNLKKNWFVVSKMTKIWRNLIWVLGILKTSTLISSFCAKYIMFELEKYRGVMFYNTEEWYKIWKKTDLWFGKWHEEFGRFLPEHSEISKLKLWWDPFIQSRKYMRLKFREELCIMTMKNDAKFEEELTRRFKIDTTIWRILTRALECLKNLHVYNVWAKKLQKSDAL